MKKLFLLGLIAIFAQTIFSQILNVELSRIQQDTNGFAGRFSADISLVKNKYQTTTFNSILHLQSKWNKHLILALSNISLLSSDGTKVENSGFQHLRYNYSFSDLITYEAFTQIQYNKITGINQRFLIGSGPRFEILKSEKNILGIATAYMYELEQYNDNEPFNRNHRASSYLAWHNKSFKNLQFVSTLYYQPLLSKMKDYRVNWAGKLIISITNKLSFYTFWGITYDTYPPIEIEKIVYSMRNGIELKL